jgi:hypothetical protein
MKRGILPSYSRRFKIMNNKVEITFNNGRFSIVFISGTMVVDVMTMEKMNIGVQHQIVEFLKS